MPIYSPACRDRQRQTGEFNGDGLLFQDPRGGLGAI